MNQGASTNHSFPSARGAIRTVLHNLEKFCRLHHSFDWHGLEPGGGKVRSHFSPLATFLTGKCDLSNEIDPAALTECTVVQLNQRIG